MKRLVSHKVPLDNPTSFLKTFLKFANICGLSPFYLVKAHNGTYELYTSKAKKIYSMCICSLSLLVYFASFRTCVIFLSRENPVTFFKLFSRSFSFIYKISVVNALWRKKEEFLEILQYLDSCPFLLKCPLPKILSSTWITHTAFTLYIIVGITCGLLGMPKGTCLADELTTQSQTSYLSPVILAFISSRVPTLLAETRFLFFLPYQCVKSVNITPVDYLCSFVGIMAFMFRFILGFFSDLFILSGVLTLLLPTIHFAKFLKPNYYSPIDYYKSLRILSSKINSLFGFLIFAYISEAVFAYPISFYDLVWSPILLQRLYLYAFYCTTVIILIGSAEICRRSQYLRNWMFDMEKVAGLSCKDVALILDDLGQNSVGMSASGMFTLNYYFVGTVTSVVLTFFIIRLQWTEVENGFIPDASPISI